MQTDETGDPLAQQRPDQVRRQVGVSGLVTGPQQMPDGVHQARHLEFLVRGTTSAQQGGGLQEVVVQIDRAAAAIGAVPGAPAGVQ